MGRVIESFEFRSLDGREFHFDLGTNDAERRVLVLYGRNTGGRDWHPIVEMDVDIETFYKDRDGNLPPPGTKDGEDADPRP